MYTSYYYGTLQSTNYLRHNDLYVQSPFFTNFVNLNFANFKYSIQYACYTACQYLCTCRAVYIMAVDMQEVCKICFNRSSTKLVLRSFRSHNELADLSHLLYNICLIIHSAWFLLQENILTHNIRGLEYIIIIIIIKRPIITRGLWWKKCTLLPTPIILGVCNP